MKYYIISLEEALKYKEKNSDGVFLKPIALKTGEYGIPKEMDSHFPELKNKPLKDYNTDKLPDGFVFRDNSHYKIDNSGNTTKVDAKVFDALDKDEEKEQIRKIEENRKKADSKPKK